MKISQNTSCIKILTVVSFPLFLNLFKRAAAALAFSLADILLIRFLSEIDKNKPENNK